MKKNMNNEELQSRREFFKKAAKGALPILGAIVLANMPAVMQADAPAMGCGGSCRGYCSEACATTCNVGCKSGCKSSCGASCTNECKGGCKRVSK